MRVIGLIGGMSWESSAEYYRILNEEIKARLGGFHSARCVMISVDFQEVETLQPRGSWDEAARVLCNAAVNAEKAGAQCLLLCTNTMHRVADQIQEAVTIPFFHIADATAESVVEKGIAQVGLLGTKYTMEGEFYTDRLSNKYDLEVLIPDDSARDFVHEVIYEELCLGKILDQSKRRFLSIIEELTARGAEGIILGCTEIPLLIQERDTPVPLFDTTRIHAEKAVAFSLCDTLK
jgi:aspartate racemase